MNCPHCATPVAADARFCPACGKATSPTATGSWPKAAGDVADLVGKEIAGRYRILAKLGEGGMGAVYRGEQMSLKRAVAVKLLRPELSANQMILRRFNAEAEAVAKLSHPNTVNIYDFGQDSDGSLFIAMEYIEGRSLRSAISKEGPFHPARAIAIALQVAASLSDAHAHSIVHRDLKPDNVMLQDRGRQKDVVRVLDFGIAKLREDTRATQQAMTQAGDMLGTPQYMAPEQIRGEAIDGRTDIYALGCMIYEMVTGRMPYEAPTVMAMLSKHLIEPVVPPSQRRPELALPSSIDQLVLCAMAKSPAERPTTMDQLAEMLSTLLASLPADPKRAAGNTGPQGAQPSAAQAVVTPPAPSMFQPQTPPPPGNAAYGAPGTPQVTPAPYSAMSPPPPGFVPNAPPGSYAPSASPAGLYPNTPPMRIVGNPPAPRSSPSATRFKTPFYVVLGALALGGAGIGVWAATKGDGKAKGSAVEPTEAPVDETKPDETKPDDDKPAPSKADPWAANGSTDDGTVTLGGRKHPVTAAGTTKTADSWATPSSDTPAPKKSVGTAETPLPAGATITPPAGFKEASTDDKSIMYVDYQRGLLVAMAPLYAGTNDPNKLAAMWSKQTGMTFAKREKVPVQGASRDALAFTGKLNGIPVVQVIVLFINDRYRIGVLFQGPANLFTDESFQHVVDDFFASNVRLP